MFGFLVWAQLLAGAAAGGGDPDSVYATPALRRLLAEAAVANRAIPSGFLSYRARIETELSFSARDSLGREQTAEIEQLATAATWRRDGSYDLHVVGYRAQNRAVPYSALSFVRGYTVPWLYGDRLQLGVELGRRRGRAARDTLAFVHPLASDREAYYRYTGGDTVALLQVGGRAIPVVRVQVVPRPTRAPQVGAFEGDLYLDGQRGQIVRMRGRFVRSTAGGPRQLARGVLVRLSGLVAVAYVDFVNAEVDGRYWLPATQRTEFQGSLAVLGETRAVFRLVSRFADYLVRDTAATADSAPAPPVRVQLGYAPRDSMDAFAGWQERLGEATVHVHADDFADVAPDAWRPVGRPYLDFRPHNLAESFRFNRVEGLYLGPAASVRFRDAMPGLEAGVFGGYAGAERTVRGGARATLRRGDWLVGARAERTLVSTNDFVPPLGDDPGFAALLFGQDLNDWVDRRLASVTATRVLGSVDRALATLELGLARDAPEGQRVAGGPFASGKFGPNRGALPGGYARAAVQLELHPDVAGDYVAPGVGVRLRYERAQGALGWQRAELALTAHEYRGPFSLGAHLDAGLVAGGILPPQQLFELGGDPTLPGYDWKEFAGDRAALFRSSAWYRLPAFSRPIHLWRNLYLPAAAPAVGASAQGGWAEQSSAAARLAVGRLGIVDGRPVSRPTDGVRATVGAGLTFFSGFLHAGWARPVDRPAPWRFVLGVGPSF